MSRPSSFYDPQEQAYNQSNGFQLPLFNQQGPSVPPPIRTDRDSLPAPATSAAGQGQQRHSISFPQPQIGAGAPHSAGAIPPPNTRPGNHMASYYQQRNEDLAPPTSASSSLGSLARSASLGARKKDPYTYASDDVESGLGNMDMTDSYGPGSGWGGTMRQGAGSTVAAGSGMYASPVRDTSMSSIGQPSGARGYPANMNPPPLPSHLSRPNQVQPRPGSSTPSDSSPVNFGATTMPNPYLPRVSDPGPSAGSSTQWADYRPSTNQRLASGSSMRSPMSDNSASPCHRNDLSPHSPMMNPYEGSSPIMGAAPAFDTSLLRSHSSQIPTSPSQPSSSQWGGSYTPFSPHRAPPAIRSQSQQLFPSVPPASASASSQQDVSMRGSSSRGGSMRGTPLQGFRDVETESDLKPVVNAHSNGRRADPVKPGKFLSPLKCLTSDLAQTYTLSNPQFRYETSDNPRRVLTKPSKPVHNDGADNEDWDYILYVNDVLGGEHGGDRYLILDVLGQGTFGQVVKCQNMRTHELYAVKVVKNKPAYLNQSKMEVAILELLNGTHDPRDEYHILRMHDSFTHKNHLCLVFECLSSNLYELIKQNQFKGLSTQLVKVFTLQLLECLAVLKDARLIHCDLKPENILLKSLQSPSIKVIDFGSACHEMQTVYTYIQSRFYRSPEVLLGLPYSTSIDMWSLGCIVVELFLGLPLFPGTSEYNQVSRITDMLGNPPTHLLEVGKQTHEFFNCHVSQGRKTYTLKPMEQYAAEHRTNESPSKQYFKQTRLKDIIMEYPYSKKNAKQSDIDKEMAQRTAFVDFVEGLLNLDPIRRWSPQQAAKHPFITGEKFTGPFQPSAPTSKRTAFPTPETPSQSQSHETSKKYGGIAQSPTAARAHGQRVYSDAGTYGHQMPSQPSYSTPSSTAQSAPRHIYGQTYDQSLAATQSAYAQHQRIPSGQQMPPPPQPNWSQSRPNNMGPPAGNYQPRVPSQTLQPSISHTSLRPNQPMMPPTNPPPNSYYPTSRNRANTINQMDAIPPALARLTHYSAPDPSGQRNLTPVLNRDDAIREWERRQAGGHSKQSSLHNTSYPQLEYLQEQAELAATGGVGWMVPGPYGHLPPGPPVSHVHGHGHGHGHRAQNSASYQMQPHISLTPHSPTSGGYRFDVPAHTSVPNTPGFLPAFPPPAATGGGPGGFDAFDSRDPSMGMMYTPLQPSQAYHTSPSGGGGAGHQARASFSGPYHNGSAAGSVPGSNNPFGGGAQQGQSSPRYQRRSQGYGGA